MPKSKSIKMCLRELWECESACTHPKIPPFDTLHESKT